MNTKFEQNVQVRWDGCTYREIEFRAPSKVLGLLIQTIALALLVAVAYMIVA